MSRLEVLRIMTMQIGSKAPEQELETAFKCSTNDLNPSCGNENNRGAKHYYPDYIVNICIYSTNTCVSLTFIC